MRIAWLLLLGLTTMMTMAGACARPRDLDPAAEALLLLRLGQGVGSLSAALLRERAQRWTVFDPYYNKEKRFLAAPLAPLLERGYGAPRGALAAEEYVLRARDGYTVPLSGGQLLEDGAAIALADLDQPGWEPVGPRRDNPGPFYLIWRHPGQQDLTRYPRPWQLHSIDQVPYTQRFPHTVPSGAAAGAPAMAGFELFRRACLRCHAINREGGSVGPELNVPRSIIEYRPAEQIRAYIRDPRSFRYSAMPAHPELTEQDLDHLLAYFGAMKDHKHDPGAGGHAGH